MILARAHIGSGEGGLFDFFCFPFSFLFSQISCLYFPLASVKARLEDGGGGGGLSAICLEKLSMGWVEWKICQACSDLSPMPQHPTQIFVPSLLVNCLVMCSSRCALSLMWPELSSIPHPAQLLYISVGYRDKQHVVLTRSCNSGNGPSFRNMLWSCEEEIALETRINIPVL